jgi:hypothetical protein
VRNDERILLYRRRATDLRTEAETLTDPDSRTAVLEIAVRYDRLAALIEAKERR